jgi:hypothetical protein
MKGVSDVRILVLALCVALLIEVTWKWKVVIAGLIAVPFFLPAAMEPMHAGIVAIVIHTLLAITYLVRRQLPDSMLN